MIYEVITTSAAEQRIRAQATYIAVEKEAPEIATRWLRRVFDAIDGLEEMPNRCAAAEEDAFRPYKIRVLQVGKFLLLYTIVEETRKVWVLNARSTWQLAQPDDLPGDLEALEEDE